ncbi:Abscisic acid 8'-hydroxylase 1 [Euphorbia peplus]|nr:Abscisic acid 8'-hydroxylase 1 [Euphorbia peplus]
MAVMMVLLCAVLVVMIIIIQKVNRKKGPKLPPGSMGLPYFGDTLQLFSQNPDSFFSNKEKSYGEIFKTRILGCPSVMVCSPEAIKFVLVNQANLFKPTYPPSKEKLIGPAAIFFHQGNYHSKMRKLVQASFSLDVIRNLIPDIESLAMSTLESCSSQSVVNTFHHMKKFTFDVAVLSVFGNLDKYYREELKKNYYILDKGYNSFPTNLPGTLYNKSLMARENINQIVRQIILERKENGLVQKDLLGDLLEFKDEHGEMLSDNQITDNIIGVLFAAQDTTASVLTWILKYIHDDSKILQAIQIEQMEIYESNGNGKTPLTWSQTRNMPVTNKVIMESLRMASIISFTYREAVEDVEYKGYLIPKGWKVLPLFRNIHQNPDFFTHPHQFNPSRFEVGPKPNTFMPFGNGVHACPGNEVAKLEIIILIHHLLTEFEYFPVGSTNRVQHNPFPIPDEGLPAKFWKKSVDNIDNIIT